MAWNDPTIKHQKSCIGNSIEGIIDLGKQKILIDEIDSSYLKTLIKDIIVLYSCEFNEACEEYETQGWEVK